MDLQVRRRYRRIGAEEAAGVASPDGEEALAQERIAQARCEAAANAVHHVVDGAAFAAAIAETDLEMILQVRSDARHVGDHVDAERLQQAPGAEAGELQ